jgi:uncharacterized membrane protein YgcG
MPLLNGQPNLPPPTDPVSMQLLQSLTFQVESIPDGANTAFYIDMIESALARFFEQLARSPRDTPTLTAWQSIMYSLRLKMRDADTTSGMLRTGFLRLLGLSAGAAAIDSLWSSVQKAHKSDGKRSSAAAAPAQRQQQQCHICGNTSHRQRDCPFKPRGPPGPGRGGGNGGGRGGGGGGGGGNGPPPFLLGFHS